ncbi:MULTISPECIES: ATP-binding protein [Metallosphaera]|uniref:AAA family ATPase n=1 Tax=Metallosphaera TaxID=41980 RepID=UPI001F06EEC5|nr:ATP-binding protein [Metallosphaera sedula]MCH1772160.1 ATP-binding protein [Metallosphaera sedula]MCP6727705.1 ATP-binding protein [Metallosphaera sedula]
MLFDTQPKDSLDDLFDREDELRKLKDSLTERMIVITGIRRVGKSSLVLSALNSLKRNYVFLDVRKIYDPNSRKVYAQKLVEELYSSLNRMSRKERIKDLLTRLNLSLEWPVSLNLRLGEVTRELSKVLSIMNEIGLREGTIPIVFDEAQYLRFSTVGLRPLLAHVYDHMKGINLVLTGSEVGLLHDFLGVEDPGSELYGRYYATVELKPFDRDKSREFLRRGFEELKVRVEDKLVERAVDELDGIVGWLVYFGKLYLERGEDAIEEVKELGSRMIRAELQELFVRSPYFLPIMRCVATLGKARWKNIKDYVMASSGKRVSNTVLSRDLKVLIKTGFLEKDNEGYRLTDPIVRYAVMREF